MDATGVVPKTGEQTSGERNVQASSECEPRKSSYNIPIRPIPISSISSFEVGESSAER